MIPQEAIQPHTAARKEGHIMTPTTDIITRLIGYAGHDEDCAGRFYKESWDGLVCTCGYSAAKADAREFMKVESALSKMIVGLDIGGISHSSVVRVDYSSDGIPTYTSIPADEFYKLEGESDGQ